MDSKQNEVADLIHRLVATGLSTLALGYYMRLWAESDKSNVVFVRNGLPEELERAFGITREQRLDCEKELAARGLNRVTFSKVQ